MLGNATQSQRHSQWWLSVGCLMCLLTAAVGCDQRLEKGRLSDYARFGRSVATDATTVLVGAYQEDDLGSAYVFGFNSNMMELQQRLVPSDPGGGTEFGDAVALSGNTAVVAAPRVNLTGAVRAGAVYVFQRSASAWSQQAKLTPPSPEAWQGFGISVAIDNNTLVVGSVDRDQGSATDAGAAYVFTRSGSTWTLSATLAAPSPAAQDKFGSAVAVAGDRVFVGALRRDSGRTADCGAVFVYNRSGSAWSLSQTVLASDRATNDTFGAALDVVTSGTTQRLVVGASGADVNGFADAGAVYVFANSNGGSFAQVQKLVANDPAAPAGLGGEVDAYDTRIVAGAPRLNGQTGAGYVYELSGSNYAQIAKLTPSDAKVNDAVGGSVAVGAMGVLLGATETNIDPARHIAGAMHWFSATSFAEDVRLSATSATAGDGYGRDVAVSGNIAAVASAAHVDMLRRDATYWSLTQQIPAPAGYTVTAIALQGDHLAVFLHVGYPGDPASPIALLHTYVRSVAGEWTLEQVLTPDLVSSALPSESANSVVMALSDPRLVVGAPRFNGGDGRVFIYERTGSTWTLTQLLASEYAATNFDMNFGRSVDIDGGVLVVAESPSSGIPNPALPTYGKAHVYDLIAGTFSLSQTITAPSPVNLDLFARAVAISGNRLSVVAADGTLRVYERTGGVFTQTWAQTVSGIGFRPPLHFDGDRLAIGLPLASYSGLTGPGEIQVFLNSGGVWTLERTERTPTGIADLNLGSSMSFDSGRILAGAKTSVTPSSVYSF